MKKIYKKKNLTIIELDSGDQMKVYYNTWLSFFVKLVNKIFKTNFIATIQPLSLNLHIHDKAFFDLLPHNLVIHEFIHILQCRIKGRFVFLIKYIWYSIKHGYYRNPFEVQAYKYENSSLENVLTLKEEIKKM